eukprot:12644175-Prorocentrum_lima.AAC.1
MLPVLVTFHHLTVLGVVEIDLEEQVFLEEVGWAHNLVPHEPLPVPAPVLLSLSMWASGAGPIPGAGW